MLEPEANQVPGVDETGGDGGGSGDQSQAGDEVDAESVSVCVWLSCFFALIDTPGCQDIKSRFNEIINEALGPHARQMPLTVVKDLVLRRPRGGHQVCEQAAFIRLISGYRHSTVEEAVRRRLSTDPQIGLTAYLS
jgi:hypothetical protein